MEYLKELCSRQAKSIQQLEKKCAEAEGYRRGNRVLWGLVIYSMIFLAIIKFNDFEITVEADSNKVIAISSTWWGIKKVHHEIKWMKTNYYDFPAWMTKDNRGNWYPYISDDSFPEPEIDQY